MSETDVKGTFLGFSGEMEPIHVGNYVEHLEKEGFGVGVVTMGGLFYKDEVACKVDFENKKDWTARLSKLTLTEPPPPPAPKLEDFGYKVGDQVAHIKYTHLTPLTITSEEVGMYKGEPCCYTAGSRATRFSQIVPYVQPVAAPKAAINTLVITLPNGKIVKIDIE